MKRILFYSENFCGENTTGGTEIATYRIAKALKKTGDWEIYNAYRGKDADITDKSIYNDIVGLSRVNYKFKNQLKSFIIRHEIDIVVNMSRFFRHSTIVRAVRESKRNCSIYFMQHFAPGSEIKKGKYTSGFHLLKLNPYNPLYWLRATVYPLIKLPRRLKINKTYRETYNNSDKVIMLSPGYIASYKSLAGLDSDDKFKAIPNIFEIDDVQASCVKEKRVLILSRMDEIQKRISLALKIWQKIEESKEFPEWHLDIVGWGHDIKTLQRFSKKLNLKNITFHGWKERDCFLQRSAILMTTSEYEGLPLSIIEALGYGCIPIAFNSYESLHDVIEDGVNGFVVDRFGDIETYSEKLKFLMRNPQVREEMALKGKENLKWLSEQSIVRQWLEILN